ncbi:hypothetical protein SAMN05660199_03545 [Klenkia soli]|uniref:Glycoprotein n=1 Tax=Klenkia soli TaxID=1052260 RepID=A0A1H0RCW9_9ACTN|nr:DUF6049 family protein [Klenkia soli]SDP27374.1 hypothetical protein SAMN05660199_03545 [Klenkia soli]
MSRRAAGGAGRPVTPAPPWAVVLVVLLGALLVPVGTAWAAPGDTAATGPVQVTVTTLEPRTVTPDSTIRVVGTLTNDGDDTITDVTVRLQRGDRLTSRQELTDDAASPSSGDAAQAPFNAQNGVLEPGDSIPLEYTATAAELGITQDGVYPVLINVNGTRDGLVERVGELSTYLVSFATTTGITSRTSVAWLWPLTERPHRDAAGAFVDDDLATEISADGRLDRALDVLEDLPDGGRDVPVTLAVDPALVEEVTAMAAGYTVAGATGQGVTAAADWLERLRALAGVHPVIALPYADVDADALQSVGLPAVVTRSLPGTPAGTAAQPVDASGDPVTTPTAAPSSVSDDGADEGAGARILAEALDVAPRTDVAWPAGGAVRSDTVATLMAGGVDELVLAQDAYADAGAAVGRTGRAAAAQVPVSTPDGQLTTVVADSALGDVVAAADTTAGGARIAEQRYLAELGVLTSQLAAVDPAVAQTVLVVPPREVESDPSWATAMMADTADQSWLAAVSVDDLARGPVADAGALVTPTDGAQLSGAGLAAIAGAVAVRDDFAAAVDDPGTVLAGYDAAVARASSAAWRGDPDGFATRTADLQQTLTGLRDRVGLVAPADGTYSLASSDAPLVLTVRNDLPFAVTVSLDLQTRSGVGFQADPVAAQRLEPESRTVVTVPTSVRQSGSFTVVARLATPAGGQLGTEVELRVASTAYGPITLVITVGAAALLGLLFLRRLVLFVLRRRRGEPHPAEDDVLAPAGDDATGTRPAPPTRSPV